MVFSLFSSLPLAPSNFEICIKCCVDLLKMNTSECTSSNSVKARLVMTLPGAAAGNATLCLYAPSSYCMYAMMQSNLGSAYYSVTCKAPSITAETARNPPCKHAGSCRPLSFFFFPHSSSLHPSSPSIHHFSSHASRALCR